MNPRQNIKGPAPQRKDCPKMTRLLPLLTASLIALSAQVIPAAAQQNLFAPRIIINDRAVTEYEFQQRLLFMRVMRAPGDLEKQALDDLIADRLRVQEAARFGITATEENVQKGMEEFAQRANMTAEQFIDQLGKAGIAPETFRDFVEAGVLWREIVRGRFTGKAKVSDEEIDRVLEAETKKAALVVSIAELIIPANRGKRKRHWRWPMTSVVRSPVRRLLRRRWSSIRRPPLANAVDASIRCPLPTCPRRSRACCCRLHPDRFRRR